jgi:hypothetical protein
MRRAEDGCGDGMNGSLASAAAVAADGGLGKICDAGSAQVRAMYVDGELTKAADALKNKWQDSARGHLKNAERVAKEGKILDRFTAKIDALRRSIS